MALVVKKVQPEQVAFSRARDLSRFPLLNRGLTILSRSLISTIRTTMVANLVKLATTHA